MHKIITSVQGLARLGLVSSLGLFGLAACDGATAPQATDDGGTGVDLASGGPVTPPAAMGFNHDGTLTPAGDVFANGQQIPISQSEVAHSCGKITYATLGRLLTSRGVSIPPVTSPTGVCAADPQAFDSTACKLYVNGNLILGIANYPARAPESPWNTTGGIVRFQDIMMAASEEFLSTANPTGNFATGACAGTALFTGTGAATSCNPDGFACLLGVPLTAGQQSLCNGMVTDPSYTDPLQAKRHTMASLASTIHLCD